MELVIYGDFNCPFSALASARAARLAAAGIAQVEWRAVAHDLEIPARGAVPAPADARAYEAEVEQVGSLLLPDERLTLRVPALRSSTVPATEAYAATDTRDRARIRSDLFRAYWEEGKDIGDPAVLGAMGLESRAPAIAADWRSEWLAFDRPLVPAMRLPDGHVSRGLGALARLADLLVDAAA
jgi:predicted DsbA family dithiol-disulfide isomerase